MPFAYEPQAIEVEYHLARTDERFSVKEDEKTIIKVRIANTGEEAARSDMFSTLKREISKDNPDVVTLVSVVSVPDLKRLEARMTLSYCNIMDGDETYFKFKDGRISDEAEFNTAWNKLPAIVTDEISDLVRDTNEQWKALGE